MTLGDAIIAIVLSLATLATVVVHIEGVKSRAEARDKEIRKYNRVPDEVEGD